MLQVCISIISTEQNTWISIPNGDLETAVYDFVGDNDWECAIVVGLKKNNITSFVNNSFHKVDSIFELNKLLIELEEHYHFDCSDIKNLSVLNMLLEDRNCDLYQVSQIMLNEEYKIHNAKSIGEVAKEYLEEECSWYKEAKEAEYRLDIYFDFEKWGEENLEANGTWLHDEDNGFILEVLDV
jgi:hypothetical protein